MATATAPASTNALPQKTSHPFTCVTCAIAFRSSDLQRGHMRSDWHRYNLKRRVASLPPLSSEVFAEKVLSAQATSKAAAEKASFEKTCQACEKTYFSENAFKNHLGSQRHRMRLATLQSGNLPDDASSVMSSTVSLGEPVGSESSETADFQDVIKGMKGADLSDDDSIITKRSNRPQNSSEAPSLRSAGTETPSIADTAETETESAMPINRCMFCNYDEVDLDANIAHMTRQHGLFIPEQEYLSDLEGLVAYLQSKVADNCECLFCHKLKNTVPGIQTHMRDKGHCMIAFNTEDEMLEVGQFYDFRSTYSDDEDDNSDSDDDDEEDTKKARGVKLGAARQAGSDEEDEEWESDEDEDDTSEDEAGPSATKRTQRSTNNAYLVDGELFLPSGRMAGHRDFRRYFRQNLRNYPTPEERALQQQKLLDSRAHGEPDDEEKRSHDRRNKQQLASRGNGGTGLIGLSDVAKHKLEVRERKDERKAQAKAVRYEMRTEKKANNQTFFRDDNFGIRR